jgi:hypothetical protein
MACAALYARRPAVPARLQLKELQQLLGACEALSFLAESAGARPVLTLRNSVQVPPVNTCLRAFVKCFLYLVVQLMREPSDHAGPVQDLPGQHALPQHDAAHRCGLCAALLALLASCPVHHDMHSKKPAGCVP